MSRYKAYPEYKDSGVEWLGEIPPHWHSRQLKYLCSYNDEVLSETVGDDFEIEYVDIGSVSAIDGISGTETLLFGNAPSRARRIVRDGDILISTVRTYLEAIASVKAPPNNLIASTGFAVIRPNVFLNKGYAAYCLRASGFIKEVVARSVGVSYPAINASDLVNIKTPEPSPTEQENIAAFLDHETAKIDALIEKQQRLIELLKEKRQAVISHAVTKGLNPNAPMKDSGVEWLGEVPAHWMSTRLKYLKGLEPNSFVDGPFGSNLKSEHFIEEGVVYVIESTFATTGHLDTAQLKKISLQHYETIKRSTAKGGDIIIAKIGARYGSSSILPKLDSKAVVSGNSLKLTVNESLLTNEFANELLRVLKANDAMDDGVNITAQPALSLGGLNNLPFLRIPLSEQHGIVKFVKEQKEIFDGLIEKAALFIELSIERRTALISSAVTGKIDVRGWQAAA